MADLKTLSDRDLLVAYELNGINLFGFDTYKHENRTRAARLRAERDAIRDEAVARGLVDTKTGRLTDKGKPLDPEQTPEVRALAERNKQFLDRMYAGMR